VGERVVKGERDVVGQIEGILRVQSHGKKVSFCVGKKHLLRQGDIINVLELHPSGDKTWHVFKPYVVKKGI
jgi:hypothetical protein